MSSAATDEAILTILGTRLARERLRQNRTQESLAEEAGVSRATVRRLEGGASTQVTNLVRILRALGLVERLEQLLPEPGVRPMEVLERERRVRRRASSSPRPDRPQGKGAWKWGDER